MDYTSSFAFAFVRRKKADKFKTPVLRVLIDSKHPRNDRDSNL